MLFRSAVGDARPLRHGPRFLHPLPKPKPIPLQSLRDQREVLLDSLSDHVYWADSLESGEELAFLRPGLQNQVLRKLRRGHWVTQGELDLHGLTVAEAKLELAEMALRVPARVRDLPVNVDPTKLVAVRVTDVPPGYVVPVGLRLTVPEPLTVVVSV